MSKSRTLHIESSKSTPLVDINTEKQIQLIDGVSIPSNARGFYQDVQDMVEENFQYFRPDTEFHFRLEYFNTASSKALFNLVKKIHDHMHQNSGWKIVWKYEEEEDFMHESGINFQEILETKFEMVKFSPA